MSLQEERRAFLASADEATDAKSIVWLLVEQFEEALLKTSSTDKFNKLQCLFDQLSNIATRELNALIRPTDLASTTTDPREYSELISDIIKGYEPINFIPRDSNEDVLELMSAWDGFIACRENCLLRIKKATGDYLVRMSMPSEAAPSL